MKIYYAPGTRAVRIVWLFEELGLPYELERFKLGDASMRDPAYLKINPMGRVPTLKDGDVTISESGAIVQYVLARHAQGRRLVAAGASDGLSSLGHELGFLEPAHFNWHGICRRGDRRIPRFFERSRIPNPSGGRDVRYQYCVCRHPRPHGVRARTGRFSHTHRASAAALAPDLTPGRSLDTGKPNQPTHTLNHHVQIR